MSSADLYEDGFPHGTKEGYDRGCRSGACPNAFEGETICRDAFLRYQGDYAYRKAVDAGETPPPLIVAQPTSKAAPHAEERVWAEPTVTVPDPSDGFETFERPRRGRKPLEGVTHPSPTMYQRGCRKDAECPSFLAEGKSCRQVALEHKRELAMAKRDRREAAASQFDRTPVTVEFAPEVAAVAAVPGVETSVVRLPNGGLVITIRVPESRSA